MIPDDWLVAARQRISPYTRVTPLTYDPELDIYLKWESYQVTGSFKVRGALNKVLSLQDWERQRGLVTASAGNHGQGVAFAGRLAGGHCIVFASEHAYSQKINAMRSLGAEVRLVPGGYGEAEQAAIAYAASTQASWISPYNDGLVIAGQATLAMEVLEQLAPGLNPPFIVPAGGGGLVCGVGAAIKSSASSARLVAVQSGASPFLHALYHTQSQDGIHELPSLADGLAGPVEAGSVTIPLSRRFVDDFLLVSEEEIAQAIRYAWFHYQERIEGSAAVSLAAVLTGRVPDRPALVIITGGNIQTEVFNRLLAQPQPDMGA